MHFQIVKTDKLLTDYKFEGTKLNTNICYIQSLKILAVHFN